MELLGTIKSASYMMHVDGNIQILSKYTRCYIGDRFYLSTTHPLCDIESSIIGWDKDGEIDTLYRSIKNKEEGKFYMRRHDDKYIKHYTMFNGILEGEYYVNLYGSFFMSNYKGGKLDGEYYLCHNRTIINCTYVQGMLDGRGCCYRRGKLVLSSNYDKGIPIGTHLEYFPSGKLKYRIIYNLGDIVWSECYHKKGYLRYIFTKNTFVHYNLHGIVVGKNHRRPKTLNNISNLDNIRRVLTEKIFNIKG